MPEDNVPAAPSPYPLTGAGLTLPAPPVLTIDATMQAALDAALAQARAQLALAMAAFSRSPGSLLLPGADTVTAAGDSVFGSAQPVILHAPEAILKGAGSLMRDAGPAMMPLDFPTLQPASLGGWLAGSTGSNLATTFLDTVPAGLAIDLGGGTSLHFGDMAEITGAEH